MKRRFRKPDFAGTTNSRERAEPVCEGRRFGSVHTAILSGFEVRLPAMSVEETYAHQTTTAKKISSRAPPTVLSAHDQTSQTFNEGRPDATRRFRDERSARRRLPAPAVCAPHAVREACSSAPRPSPGGNISRPREAAQP